jgi:hypothetical protein
MALVKEHNKIYALTGKNAVIDSTTNGQIITLFTIYKIQSF